MKKLVTLGLVFAVFALALCGCGAKTEEFTCDYCDATVNETPNNVSFGGKEMKVCADCKDVIDQLNEAADKAQDALDDLNDQLGDLF